MCDDTNMEDTFKIAGTLITFDMDENGTIHLGIEGDTTKTKAAVSLKEAHNATLSILEARGVKLTPEVRRLTLSNLYRLSR